MYFCIAVIRLSENKFPEKNCKFGTLYFKKSLCETSEFPGDDKTEPIFCNPWKFSIWNVSIFQKNVPKEDIFFKFSNSIYFPLGCRAKMIFGTFWDNLVHFLKNIVSQFWTRYGWSYNCLNIVSSIKFKAF